MDQQTLIILAAGAALFLLYRQGYLKPAASPRAAVPPMAPAPSAQLSVGTAAPVQQTLVLRHEMAPTQPTLAVAPEEPVHTTDIVVPFKIHVVPQGPANPKS